MCGADVVVGFAECHGRDARRAGDRSPDLGHPSRRTVRGDGPGGGPRTPTAGDTDNTTGLGLGLALARGLTEAMNGTLTPEDTPGDGLTMVVSLPEARRYAESWN
ncbi:ATP-binding protein [Streptomyces shenzhenensis]